MTDLLFIDEKRVSVKTSNGDSIILGFQDTMNYQINEQKNNMFIDCLKKLFDEKYDGNLNTIWGFNRHLIQFRFNSIFSVQLDRDKERERIGARIKQLREEQNIDAKTLAMKAGIDAANLCRIEQGRYSAGLDILAKIATALECKIDFVRLLP